MRAIESLTVTQIRVFRADAIHPSLIQINSVAKVFQEAFGFRQFMPIGMPGTAPAAAVIFGQGEFKSGDTVFGIQRVHVESRRIIIVISATSAIASEFFAELIKVIEQIDPREKKPSYAPLILTEETESVVQLDFPMTKLFESGSLHDFCQGLSEKVDGFGSSASIYPSGLKFRVAYSNLPEELKLQGIQHLDKEIRIEVRAQTTIAENAYFIQSPNSSDMHIKLIELIEEKFRPKR